MRYYFSHVLWGNNVDMNVRCTDRELSKEGHLPFSTMFEAMRSSRFCPVFPGDAASTRRLSETFLAGCIPVFLGPPYHSMPFSDTVRSSYNNVAHPSSSKWQPCTPVMALGCVKKGREGLVHADLLQTMLRLCWNAGSLKGCWHFLEHHRHQPLA